MRGIGKGVHCLGAVDGYEERVRRGVAEEIRRGRRGFGFEIGGHVDDMEISLDGASLFD